jgi:hypothetical protein
VLLLNRDQRPLNSKAIKVLPEVLASLLRRPWPAATCFVSEVECRKPRRS